ncbi:MAG TPA: hypothetical protein QF359_11420 [Rhodospirillales bacterium]|jgi:Na+/melibiose symporter-like transporter|nr:hypothetical protein [Rhodospirillales bacterium]MDP7624722.1 hypothetical protein [Rhodospirillales bacterium]HJO87562.1 hypothetical protein [Rhodospirillales bacterium]|tara:strand:+ start:715 stop:1014 length:300 start_codon:yes stop_codon:yes gene_type:complete
MNDISTENQNTSEHGAVPEDEKTFWLDDMRNVHKIFWALVVICCLLMVSDLFIHKHTDFGFQGLFGFFGLFGFCLSFLLVLTSKQLRKIVMRDEDYYDK